MTNFHALDVSLQVIRSLRRAVRELRRHDPRLTEQIRSAASSACLNLAEGNRRGGKDRTHLFRIAAGSAGEVRAALRVAEAWGDLSADAIAEPLQLLDQLLAMLWRLTH